MHASPRPLVLLATLLVGCPGEPAANQAPAITVTAPTGGAAVTADHGVELRGVASDPDTVPETLAVTWSADGQVVCDGLTPLPDGSTTCTWVATLGGGAIEVVVTDPDGLTGTAALTLVVQAENQLPTCAIGEPADGASLLVTDPVTLRGTATDPDDDSLSVVVVSSVDKELGSASVGADGVVEMDLGTLSEGEHTLTMTATDPHGARCEAAVEIEMVPEPDTAPPDPDTAAPDPDTGATPPA